MVIWLYDSPAVVSVCHKPEGRERTVDWVPEEDFASEHPAPDFVHPLIVKGHPLRPRGGIDVARLHALPEIGGVQAFVGGDGIQRPPAFHGEYPDLEGFRCDTSCRRAPRVPVATGEHDQGAEQEHDSWESIRQPESDVFLFSHISSYSTRGIQRGECVLQSTPSQ